MISVDEITAVCKVVVSKIPDSLPGRMAWEILLGDHRPRKMNRMFVSMMAALARERD
jgi:hypothetical protein